MNKIVSIFFLTLLFPFIANGDCITQQDTCQSFNGCYLQNLMGTSECTQCNPGFFNNNTTGLTTECSPCPISYNDLGKIPNLDAQDYGQSECPWMCDVGYFKSITNQSNNQAECLSCPDASHPKSYGTQDITNIGTCTCPTNTNLIKTTESNVDKYYCGQCGVGVQPNTNNGISTCTCPATSNRVHGNQAYRTNNGPVECACPSGANWDSNRCKCSANKYLSQGTDGVYSCESCPEHSTSTVGSTNVNDCQCDDDFPTRILDENNKLIGCSACADNAIFHNGSCQCKSGYYDDGASSCAQCPIGTTTTIGATQRSDCKMTSATKFCYGSGDNKKCMHLIPAGTVISAPNNT